jgi:hypothetical protein
MNLYLSQIAKWLENTTGISQQIIHTSERGDIRYTDHDSQSDAMDMTIIADADIDIKSISWSGENGIGLNTDSESNLNGEKVHVILWSGSEVSKDDRGHYMDSEGALNGELVLYNPRMEVTDDVISEMLNIGTPEVEEPEIEAAALRDKVQALMDEVYSEWQKEENKNKGKWDILDGFSEAHQIAVVFGNFNYQVENGGIEQWIYNGYFYDDAEKLTEHLETGAELDERCRTILDEIYKLDQYAQETDCDRYGNYSDPGDEDGERSFIGDMINCDTFDTWYYENCGKDDWWEIVCGIIDKAEAHESEPVRRDERGGGNAAPSYPLRVYIENVHDDRIGGFTIPLPTTPEALQPFFDGTEITGWQDIVIAEVLSDIKGLGKFLSKTKCARKGSLTSYSRDYCKYRFEQAAGKVSVGNHTLSSPD